MLSLFKKTLIYILMIESRLVIRKYKPRIIAVTGSVGKTSTKDAIYAVLASADLPGREMIKHVRKSEKSFNSEIGVPLTILGVGNAWKDPLGWLSNMMRGLELVFTRNDYPDILVLEVGADHPGDIENLVKWLHPDVAVITKVGDVPVHVEFFGLPEAVLREKIFLAKGVRNGGTVILYADDDKLKNQRFEGRKAMTYGTSSDALVRGSSPALLYSAESARKKPIGISFNLEYAGDSVPISLYGVLGIQHVYPILAAAAVGLNQGDALRKIAEFINAFKPPRGRMNLIDGMDDSTIIDDTYNSSPTALAVALAALADVEGAQRKVAVLGDMMELGKYSTEQHHKAGALVAKSLDPARGDLLVTVGQRAKGIRDGAIEAGMSEASILSFDDSNAAALKLKTMVKTGDAILIKGSQSPRLERVTKALMADPSHAGELLVRQEKEWLEKP